MVEHRKYLPQELDYVLSRVAAGWKFETIAKAFKKDFASHWADRLFTKKQVQYIKNTYRRPPGTIQPYNGPIPIFPTPTPHPSQTHAAGFQATMDSARQVDQYGQNNLEGRQETNNHFTQHAYTSAQSPMVDPEYHGQQYVEDGNMFTHGPGSPYNFSAFLGNSSDCQPTTIDDIFNPTLGSSIAGETDGVTNNYQPVALAGIGTQFSQIPQWTQTAPSPSIQPRFSGYASHLDPQLGQAIPSLEKTLLNSPAPDHLLSGEHVDRLLKGPGPRLERLNYAEDPTEFGLAVNVGQTMVHGDAQDQNAHANLPRDPQGCSIENTTYTDRSGWWYTGHHDGWCRIPHEHRHNYDGGVYFSNYDSYTQNIYTEQNDHVTGFLLGLCHQMQTQHPVGEAMCLHRSCEEARRVAQQLVDASLPEGHGLRQAPLSQPHPVVIRLLHDLNGRLPEGYVYDPISQRVVPYELPRMGEPMLRNELANTPKEGAVEKDGQEAS
ncbi:hypothetical protein N0V82_009839 [Gnomoniopsis sp. IMI 355080]|nr:hypothetical protein N0V82_009839 [Gnomoniopsis sp. IMI 355080]